MSETEGSAVCNSEKVCGERFARDKERIERLEEKGDTSASVLAESIGVLERITERLASVETTLSDHETRLREAEKRPTTWVDKGIAAAISAAISAVVAYFSAGGEI